MGDESNQRKAFDFLVERINSQEPFTKDDFREASGWDKPSTFDTYWSKQFQQFCREGREEGKFRVTERFRPYISWDKFRRLVTQVRRGADKNYVVHAYPGVLIFEFFMPLANEEHLRQTLDALFYKNRILSRLKSVDLQDLVAKIPRESGQSDDDYYEMVCHYVDNHFGGYSISHVDGRFRGCELLDVNDAATMIARGERYLIDETTAIVKFIFKVGTPEKRPPESEGIYEWFNSVHENPSDEAKSEAEKVRWLFGLLFIKSIVEAIGGEEEIWMIESGMRNRLHIWKDQTG